MTENRVLIFAGTTEGRKLSEYLAGHAVRVHICVATAYGESLLPEGGSVTASHDRMDEPQMERLIRKFQPDYVVDATHPYADEVTRNVREACRACDKAYLRLIRESSEADGCIYADTIEEAVTYLSGTTGNILAATGSKELEAYTRLKDYKERLYARVLSVAGVVEKCEGLGVAGRHLICMQGPFSVEMNTAMLREYQIEWFVTKESGKAGGFPEKKEAAKRAGAKLIVIGRPEKDETGYSFKEVCGYLAAQLGLTAETDKTDRADREKREIALVGIGTGHRDYLTLRAKELCRQAELVIGAERMVRAAVSEGHGQDVFFEYRTAEIANYIKEHPEYRKIVIAFSGDVGFYSGAKKLLSVFREDEDFREKTDVEVVPGISSVVYFCAKLYISWENAAFVSMHGKDAHLMSVIRDHEKTIVIVGNAEGVRKLGVQMLEYGYGDLDVWVGESLSYTDEKIEQFAAKDLREYKGNDLAVLYIHNPQGGKKRLGGIPDADFIRGKVPMTKEEVRSISISKLCIRKESVVYDIGAGTGSVAVEAAMYAAGGEVYAIEMKEDAAALILENKRKFKTDNLYIIQGKAPEALDGLPAPDCVFVGGSKGRLKDILQKITEKFLMPLGKGAEIADEHKRLHVVINAITLETLSEAAQCLEMMKKDEKVWIKDKEIVQLSAARSKNVGDYHMMMGQNPIFIISFCMEEM